MSDQPPTYDELLYIAQAMAEDLQDYLDDAAEAGSDGPATRVTRGLLAEWEALYRRSPIYWVNTMAQSEEGEQTRLEEL